MNRTFCVLALALSACSFNEGLVIENMTGRILIPAEAATRVMPNGETVENDARLIGPVTLGFYPEVRDDIYQFPHPAVGPSFSAEQAGDTYPYGGTTVGDIRYPCVADLVCRMTSGRFTDYDDIIDWYGTYYEDPIIDRNGQEIVTGEYLRQTCFQQLRVTSDEEVRIIQTEDRNEDGTIDTNDLDFVLNADGFFEAEFIVYQQEFYEGFELWGWMDSPSAVDGRVNTCDTLNGFGDFEYNQGFQGGLQYPDLLNFPEKYIQQGDWVAGQGFKYESVDDEVVLTLDFEVTE